METIIYPTVEVFKTNVQAQAEADMLVGLLQKHITNSIVNFDLEDCDKILRIESLNISHQLVAEILEDHGYLCQLLE